MFDNTCGGGFAERVKVERQLKSGEFITIIFPYPRAWRCRRNVVLECTRTTASCYMLLLTPATTLAVLKQIEKQGSNAENQDRRAKLQRDLFYIKNFPRDRPYISLFPDNDTEESKAKRKEMRALIDEAQSQKLQKVPMAVLLR